MGGTQRAAKFVKYLPEFGWQPIVLTVKDIAYYAKDESLVADVASAQIHRTGSLDPQRLLWLLKNKKKQDRGEVQSISPSQSLLSSLLSWIFIPDNKLLWLPFAFWRARKIIKNENISHVITTSPPHSVHILGLVLKRLFKVSWLADFRDGWADGNFQNEPTAGHRALNRLMEKKILNSADAVVTVSAGLTRKMAKVVKAENKFHTITNGFDQEDFESAKVQPVDERFTMTYSGTISEISPVEDLLKALSGLLLNKKELKDQIKLQFVGKDISGTALKMVEELDLSSLVEFFGYVNHRKAIANILRADLLIYPVSDRASQDFIPGKTFEYLASGKPVLVIGPEIEGVSILQNHSEIKVVENGNLSKIEESLLDFIEKGRKTFDTPNWKELSKYERKALNGELAKVLDSFALGK